MANLTGSRSIFPNGFDAILELYNLPASQKANALRFQFLKTKENLTSEEQTELNTLTNTLQSYIVDVEKWNRFGDILVNLQNFIYSRITEYYQFRGDYSNTTTYPPFNSVRYLGDTYLALQPTTGNIPTNETYWMKLGGKGDQGDKGDPGVGLTFVGEYNNALAYNVNNAVRFNSAIYYCIQATIGNAPPNATYWALFLDIGDIIDVIGNLGDLNTIYKDDVVGAINETFNKIGDLSQLDTSYTNDLVGAVNEVKGDVITHMAEMEMFKIKMDFNNKALWLFGGGLI